MTIRGFLSVAVLLCLILAACQSEAPQDVDTSALYEQYGEDTTTEGAVPIQAVLAEREAYVGQHIKVEGTVAEVCQHQGCWLTFHPDDAAPVRIDVSRTEDGEYTFTVPTDISGRRAIVQGVLNEEAADGDTQPELVLTATGVLVEST